MDKINDPKIAATIGTFDGVHRGHKYLLKELKALAVKDGFQPCAITFDVPPISVIHPGKEIVELTDLDEKLHLLEDATGSAPIVLHFDRKFADTPAQYFIQNVLYEKLGVRLLLVGYDHHFGKNGEGTFERCKEYGEELGMKVIQAAELRDEEQRISSSTIRNLLLKGKIEEANTLLGYPYCLAGNVESGFKIGRTLGYPTANIHPNSDRKLVPADGVYAVRVHLSGCVYDAMLYIGKRPTLGVDMKRTIEVNIFDINENLYGEMLTLEFRSFIRADKKFASFEELSHQISLDKVAVQKFFDR